MSSAREFALKLWRDPRIQFTSPDNDAHWKRIMGVLESLIEERDTALLRDERARFELAKRYDGRKVADGVCDHATDCNIWGDDGRGKVNGDYVSIPCSCGAHWNWVKKLGAKLARERAKLDLARKQAEKIRFLLEGSLAGLNLLSILRDKG